MIELWGLFLGFPILAFGGGVLFSARKTFDFIEGFKVSKPAAAVLTVLAWFWTAYECHIVGIDVFDLFLKRFPGQLWIMAAVLSWLTYIWMPANLPMRALAAILMLIPAELFKTTRLLLPEAGAAPVHVFVVTAYIGAIVGMYGMFYPWRLEKGLAWFQASPVRFRILGVVCFVWGAALIATGFFV